MTDAERVLPLFPLDQVVLYPGMPLPLRIFEERYKVMIGACQVTDQLFGVLLIRNGSEVGAPAEPERVGCTARMLRVNRLPDGQMLIMTVGEQRFRLVGPARVTAEGYLVGDARMLTDAASTPIPAELLSSIAEEFGKYQASMLAMSDRSAAGPPPELAADPVRLSYQVASTLQVHPRERQHLLELDDVAIRLKQELSVLRRENRPFSIGPFSIN
ncbi:MAG TPA: LON peptidase substrate-binding domain-containing protein [Chloroflexota bacterium]|nr:LON peptidase substrate-binding domain-containing protein [Chloroflexota bacterium]